MNTVKEKETNSDKLVIFERIASAIEDIGCVLDDIKDELKNGLNEIKQTLREKRQ